MKVYLFILSLFFCGITYAQNSVTGSVMDSNNQPISGANVKISGETAATTTDSQGNFTLSTTKQPPFSVEVSSVGYGSKKVNVSDASKSVSVMLTDEENKLNEIVVSASRTPERVIESPVTIERMGLQAIKSTTAATYYDGLENLKEVHFNTSSLSFKSINTRGFATVANTRFLQLVDGMDNSSPALNFVLGNLIGVSELDVASVELLPGASSALYGANAFNGILFMNSKSPFTSQGISFYSKYGQTSQDVAGTNDYWDFGIRAAHAFNKYIAGKANFTYNRGTEWIADDRRSMTAGGIGHQTNQNYDGLNLYGDEVTTFIPNVGQVSRDGYREKDMSDNKIESVKADFSLHFKPWANDFEIILQSKIGTGNTIYQGANRYSLKNFYMNQNRLEVKGKNFFVRAYMTDEDAGDSYDMRFAAWNVNRLSKTDTNWFTDYATAFQLSSAILGLDSNGAANYARAFANTNLSPGLNLTPNTDPNNPSGPRGARFEPGTPEFNAALKTVTENPDLTKGAKFIDHSKLYHGDVNYNLRDVVKIAEIQVGGSLREYVMNSEGTIFTDYDGPIKYDEFGLYTQVTKKFLADRLKFTGSIRYDKSQNFDGFFSPRIAFVYSAGASKRHNFRISYQTGFHNPTTQDQYIGLDLGPFALIGSEPANLARFTETQPVSAAGRALLGLPTDQPYNVPLNGTMAYNNSYTVASVTAFAASQNPADLRVANIGLVKPERVQAFEIGYRSVIENDLSIDLNGYLNKYNDFLNQSRVITPYYGTVGTDSSDSNVQLSYAALANGDRRVYQVYSNSKSEITSVGFGIGLAKKVYKGFELGVNYNAAFFGNQFDGTKLHYDALKDPEFIPGFNTPRHRVKGSFGNEKLFENFGFNFNVRWSTEYLWQSSFADGYVPENTVLDAQVNYGIPVIKSVIKVGANNLGGKDYLQVVGAGQIGRLYYVSLTINP